MKTIKLPRELGIKKAQKLYSAAKEIMAAGPDCAMDFSKVRRIDLSIAQMVLALKRECSRKGGNFEIRNANEVTARLLELVGVKCDN